VESLEKSTIWGRWLKKVIKIFQRRNEKFEIFRGVWVKEVRTEIFRWKCAVMNFSQNMLNMHHWLRGMNAPGVQNVNFQVVSF